MVECTLLEIRRTGDGTVGSNPTLSASKSSAPVKRSLVRTKPRHWRGFVVYAFLAVPLAGFAADIGNESGGDEPEQLALGGPIDGQWHVLPEGIRGLDRRAFSQ